MTTRPTATGSPGRSSIAATTCGPRRTTTARSPWRPAKRPGKSGLELVKSLHEIDPATRSVVLTGYGSIATAIDAVRLGAAYYLSKPADADDIVGAFARAEAPPLTPPAPAPAQP